MKLKRLVEQHFHGAFGINFNTASVDEIKELSHKMFEEGFGYIFPTLVTDTVDNIVKQIEKIERASAGQTSDCAKIEGVHLEGIFLNPDKKGIHDSGLFMAPTVDNYKLLDHPFIKIVTLAPELCTSENNLITYLKSKGIKVQAGHCLGGNLSGCDGVTHMFNAMGGVAHRGKSTALSALIDDKIYTEIIADGIHVSDDALKLLFKVKPAGKILLISDCLPCTKSDCKEFIFAGKKIYYDGEKATSSDGTLAGSSKLLTDIVRMLLEKNIFNQQYIDNSYEYHGLADIGTFNL